MRYQTKPGRCGPAVIVNALRCYGVRVSERSVGKLAGTSENGTNEFGIQAALTQLNFKCVALSERDRSEAWFWICAELDDNNRPVIVAVDNADHWICVIGTVAERVIVVDSSNTKNNKKENGIHIYGRVEFLKKWRNAKNGEYYGLSVYK